MVVAMINELQYGETFAKNYDDLQSPIYSEVFHQQTQLISSILVNSYTT